LRLGDAVGISMPMTSECMVNYLDIIKASCVDISIVDLFKPDEIATRCRISNAIPIFTQDVIFQDQNFYPYSSEISTPIK